MYKTYSVFIIMLFLILISEGAMAQREGGEVGMGRKQSESKTKQKEIKPSVGLWKMSGYGAFQDSVKLDTLHDVVHIYHPVYKNLITASYLGNYGTPALDNDFFGRNYSSSFFFLHTREAYLLMPSEVAYYNTHTPYTRLDYSQSENKSNNSESRFDVIHTQNVTPFWNFTFKTNQEKSEGQYNYQEAKNNFVGLYTSYNRANWNVYGGVISNSIQNEENGGITEEDDWLHNGEDPEYWSTNLDESLSKFNNTHFYVNTEYRLGRYVQGDKQDINKAGKSETAETPEIGEVAEQEINFDAPEKTETLQRSDRPAGEGPPERNENSESPGNSPQNGLPQQGGTERTRGPQKQSENAQKRQSEEEVFVPLVGILYSVNYERSRQRFYEEEDDDNTFFDTTYYSDDYYKDDIRFNRLTNIVQLKQYENTDKKYSFGKRAFLGHELNRGSMPGIEVNDSTWNRTEIKYSNLFVGGGIFRETGKFWRWNFDGKLYLTGRNAGQTEINGSISKPFKFWGDSLATMNFTGAIENRVPDYFQEEFYSNHVKWNQGLEMEQRLTAGASLKIPQRNFEMGAKYALINNYIYNDSLSIPNQTNDEILVLSAYIDKDFNYRTLHFRTRLLWQKSSNEEFIHVPELSTFVSAYFQFIWSKVMLTQIGVDMRYNTKYYADAYAPSTGLFYLQNETQYGNYPYIDVYASLRLKRTRVFFKYMNVGTHFLDGTYMTTHNYPMNRATFRLGVSWAFYD